MSWKNLDQLRDACLRLKLLDAGQLDAAIVQLPPFNRTADGLLDVLERRGLLTSYQLSRLRKGETDGLVLGDYKLLYRNAAGSFARVFRGCSVIDGAMIGLKVLRQRWAKDPASVAQFHREAELCMKLRHPSIVPIYSVGSQGDYHWLTMEFVEGGNLRDLLAIRKKLSPAEATRCALEMAEGLEYALRMRITHRDLKLTNVLMSSTGSAKLVDFGLAGLEESLDKSGSGAGDGQQRALEYAAIEKNTGAPPNDPRSDLYFLGAIYYELLTGVPPYPRTNDRQERKQVTRYRNIRPIRQVDPNLPRSCVEIVERLLQFNPDLRYQTPAEVVAELRASLRQLGDAPKPAAAGLPEAAAALRTDGESDLPDPSTSESRRPSTTVLMVEKRLKHQDMLRQYFTKHQFRVLVLADADRALTRLASATRPDVVLLVGDSIGDDIVDAYRQAVDKAASKVAVVGVLSEKQSDLRSRMAESDSSRVLVQPVTLREIRKTITRLVARRAEHA